MRHHGNNIWRSIDAIAVLGQNEFTQESVEPSGINLIRIAPQSLNIAMFTNILMGKVNESSIKENDIHRHKFQARSGLYQRTYFERSLHKYLFPKNTAVKRSTAASIAFNSTETATLSWSLDSLQVQSTLEFKRHAPASIVYERYLGPNNLPIMRIDNSARMKTRFTSHKYGVLKSAGNLKHPSPQDTKGLPLEESVHCQTAHGDFSAIKYAEYLTDRFQAVKFPAWAILAAEPQALATLQAIALKRRNQLEWGHDFYPPDASARPNYVSSAVHLLAQYHVPVDTMAGICVVKPPYCKMQKRYGNAMIGNPLTEGSLDAIAAVMIRDFLYPRG